MKIWILPSWYPTREDPLSGSFFREQGEALVRSGHRVTVICRAGDRHAPRCVERTTTPVGLEEYTVRYRTSPVPGLSRAELLRMLLPLARQERPEVVHVQSRSVGYLARFLKQSLGIPYVIQEHASRMTRTDLPAAEIRAARRDYDAAAVRMAVSGRMKECMERFTSKSIEIVPNMVSPAFFEKPLSAPSAEGFRFTAVGGLIPGKGVDVLLRAFALVHGQHPETTLALVGDGESRRELEELMNALSLTGAVRFLGALDRDACAETVASGHAYVSASRGETFGLAGAEALALGRPAVLTKTGAWGELISPETGLAVDADNVTALAKAMEQLVRGYDRFDPALIRSRCRERFAPEKVCALLENSYRQAADTRRK